MASTHILAVGSIHAGQAIDWHVTPPAALAPVIVTDADLDALLDEVYGKPGLGVEGSAGLFDDDARYDGSIEDDYDWIRGGC